MRFFLQIKRAVRDVAWYFLIVFSLFFKILKTSLSRRASVKPDAIAHSISLVLGPKTSFDWEVRDSIVSVTVYDSSIPLEKDAIEREIGALLSIHCPGYLLSLKIMGNSSQSSYHLGGCV